MIAHAAVTCKAKKQVAYVVVDHHETYLYVSKGKQGGGVGGPLGCATWVQSMQYHTDLSWCSGKGEAIVISVHSCGTALAIQTGQPLMHNKI